MAIVTKIMMGLAIIAGIVGIVMGMSIPDGVDKIIKDRDKFKESSSKNMETVGKKDEEIGKITSDLTNEQGKTKKLDGDLKKAQGDLKTAESNEQNAKATAKTATDNLQGAINSKQLAEGALQGEIDAKNAALAQVAAMQQQLNSVGGASVQLRKYQALMINGVPVDFAMLQQLVAAEAKRTAAPPKPGKVTKVNAGFGLYYINYGEKYTAVGTRYTVRRNNKLVGYLTVIRIQGKESVCKLDKTNSPGLPLAGDDIKK